MVVVRLISERRLSNLREDFRATVERLSAECPPSIPRLNKAFFICPLLLTDTLLFGYLLLRFGTCLKRMPRDSLGVPVTDMR